MAPEMNRLLKALPSAQRETVKENSELVTLQGEQQLWEQGEELTTAYMPCNAVISLLQTMSDGLSVEVASVGNEGIVGVPLLLGTERSISRAVCQVPGTCWKISDKTLTRIWETIPVFDTLVHRYTYILLRQVVQAAGCNSLHPAEKRFARILLEMNDRSGKTAIELSQQFIAEILGVRRETIGVIAGYFQRSGHISYVRGRIELLNRACIEEMACECYGVLRRELDEIFQEWQ